MTAKSRTSWTFAVTSAALFMASLDNLVVTTALPSIREHLHASPVPIEDAIGAHPAVRRVAVIGQADERLGERICAVIGPKGTPPALDQLNAWLTERGLSARKLPEVLQVVEDMPVTAAGKIRKVELRRFVEGDR
jgi:non-ribosomal peptide synthetase component E (peptide arylation enzyme)